MFHENVKRKERTRYSEEEKKTRTRNEWVFGDGSIFAFPRSVRTIHFYFIKQLKCFYEDYCSENNNKIISFLRIHIDPGYSEEKANLSTNTPIPIFYEY